MNREEIISLLDEAITIEEVSTIENLASIREKMGQLGFDEDVRRRLDSHINTLVDESAKHSKMFSEHLVRVIKSGENDW